MGGANDVVDLSPKIKNDYYQQNQDGKNDYYHYYNTITNDGNSEQSATVDIKNDILYTTITKKPGIVKEEENSQSEKPQKKNIFSHPPKSGNSGNSVDPAIENRGNSGVGGLVIVSNDNENHGNSGHINDQKAAADYGNSGGVKMVKTADIGVKTEQARIPWNGNGGGSGSGSGTAPKEHHTIQHDFSVGVRDFIAAFGEPITVENQTKATFWIADRITAYKVLPSDVSSYLEKYVIKTTPVPKNGEGLK